MAAENVDIVIRGKDETTAAFKSARGGLDDLEKSAGKPGGGGGGGGGGGVSAALGGIGMAATAAAAVAVAAIGTIGAALFDISGQADTARTALQGLDGVNLDQVLSDASLLSARYGTDLNETLGATRTLMDEFGLSSEEANNLLIAGFDKGLNTSDDFLDTLSEYSNLMADNGFTADEFFSALETGMAGGVLGTDKAADALKEFGIRVREIPDSLFGPDGSLRTSEMFSDAELDAMISGFEDGTVTMADAFNMIMPRLAEIDNEVHRNTIGTKLFGTQWEDLGMSAMMGISTTTTSMADLNAAAATSRESFTSLGEVAPRLWSEFSIALLPAADAMLALANDAAPALFGAMESGGQWVSRMADGFAVLVGQFKAATGEGGLLSAAMATAQPILDKLNVWAARASIWFQESLVPALTNAAQTLGTILGPRIMALADEAQVTLMPALEAVGAFLAEHLPTAIGIIAPILGTLASIGIAGVEGALRGMAMAYDTVVVPAFNGMKSFVEGLITNWNNFNRGIGEARRLIGLATSAIKDFFTVKVPDWIANGIKMPEFRLPGIPGFAGGVTDFAGGVALVGERGPELLTLPRGSNVTPADQTQRLLSQLTQGGGATSLADHLVSALRDLATGGPQGMSGQYAEELKRLGLVDTDLTPYQDAAGKVKNTLIEAMIDLATGGPQMMNRANAATLKARGLVDVDLGAEGNFNTAGAGTLTAAGRAFLENLETGYLKPTDLIGNITDMGRQFLAQLAGAPELRGIGQGPAPSVPSAASAAQGGAMGSGGATVNLTVAPVINNPMLDTAARLEELKGMIVDAAKTAIGQAYSGSVDALILGGGTVLQ
jgi:hypothetical protein